MSWRTLGCCDVLCATSGKRQGKADYSWATLPPCCVRTRTCSAKLKSIIRKAARVETASVEDPKTVAPEKHARNKTVQTERTRSHFSRNHSTCQNNKTAGNQKPKHTTEAHVRIDHASTETNTTSDEHQPTHRCVLSFPPSV